MIRCLLRFVWLALLASAVFGADSRCIFVLRDVSSSFHEQLPVANRRVQAMLRMCGPDEQFVIIDVGQRFQPKSNVRLHSETPPVPAAILEPTRNSEQSRRNQIKLDAIWNDVGAKVQAIGRFLDQPIPAPANSTDLYGALEYCSLRVKQDHCAEAYVLLFTDLHHNFQGVSSDRPPVAPLPYPAARVETYFVPWTNLKEWQSKEGAWRAWFVDQGQARRFAMFTEADSLQRNPLPQSRIPRKVPSPLTR